MHLITGCAVVECVLQGEISTMSVENQGPEIRAIQKLLLLLLWGGGGGGGGEEVSVQHWPGNIVCFVVVVCFFLLLLLLLFVCCCFFGGGVLWTTLTWEYCLGGFSGQYLTFAASFQSTRVSFGVNIEHLGVRD